jgi:hypothetical protein
MGNPIIQNKPEPNNFHVRKSQLKPVTGATIIKTLKRIDELKGPENTEFQSCKQNKGESTFKKFVKVEEDNGM